MMDKDPVCGMEVDENTAEWKSEYKGMAYYFCAERCKQIFDKRPGRFTK
jgi:YHS domain-containing protein